VVGRSRCGPSASPLDPCAAPKHPTAGHAPQRAVPQHARAHAAGQLATPCHMASRGLILVVCTHVLAPELSRNTVVAIFLIRQRRQSPWPSPLYCRSAARPPPPERLEPHLLLLELRPDILNTATPPPGRQTTPPPARSNRTRAAGHPFRRRPSSGPSQHRRSPRIEP
jgi:hypothetical protein